MAPTPTRTLRARRPSAPSVPRPSTLQPVRSDEHANERENHSTRSVNRPRSSPQRVPQGITLADMPLPVSHPAHILHKAAAAGASPVYQTNPALLAPPPQSTSPSTSLSSTFFVVRRSPRISARQQDRRALEQEQEQQMHRETPTLSVHDLKRDLDNLVSDRSQTWSFDFAAGRPLTESNGNYIWTPVNVNKAVSARR